MKLTNFNKQYTMKNGYTVFLIIELARAKGIIPKELEYDLTWETGMGLYDDFVQSKYDEQKRGLYDCVNDFLDLTDLTEITNQYKN